MNSEEALNLLDRICANVSMSRENHVQVQFAISYLRDEIQKIPKVEETEETKEP